MKRGQKGAAPVAATAIPREVFQLAKEKLQDDYLGFVAGNVSEEPKQFAARHAAAREALDHLAMLCTLGGGDATVEQGENLVDQVLQAAREGMATENKT
jgi:hypothetical protein